MDFAALSWAVPLAVGVVTYAVTQFREVSLGRAEMVRSYTCDFYGDPAIIDLFTDLDYDRFTFVDDQTTWLGQKPEQTLVHMLDIFNSVGHSCQRHIIRDTDIQGTTLGYAIVRAYGSSEVRKYLAHVQRWDQEHLGTGIPFQYFQELAVRLERRSAMTRQKNADRSAIVGDATG